MQRLLPVSSLRMQASLRASAVVSAESSGVTLFHLLTIVGIVLNTCAFSGWGLDVHVWRKFGENGEGYNELQGCDLRVAT
jgi:hypothetical protein